FFLWIEREAMKRPEMIADFEPQPLGREAAGDRFLCVGAEQFSARLDREFFSRGVLHVGEQLRHGANQPEAAKIIANVNRDRRFDPWIAADGLEIGAREISW